MKEIRSRKKNDHLVGEQNILDYTRTKKPKYEGNLYEKFPPLTDEELISWSGTRKRLFDSRLFLRSVIKMHKKIQLK
jgi:hypothetical protein